MKTTFLFVLLSISSLLQSEVFELSTEHSKINFEVDYMGVSKVVGAFKKYSAHFDFDSNLQKVSHIEAIILSNSIDTNDPKRDFHLRGHEFFFAGNYPEAKFNSNADVFVKLNKKVPIAGVLEIRGIKKEVRGDIIFKGRIIDPWGKENLFFDFNLIVNRQDFEMKWNKVLELGGFLVGDEVNIKISVQAQKPGDKTSFSTHMIPSNKAIIEREMLRTGKIKKLSTSTNPKDR